VQIVAVIRGQHVHANPGPEFVLASSDTIIAAATLPTITTLAAHLAAPAP
jgi:K+/H+ antiporter YhaU regulatory subunit KhtT